MRVSVPRSRVSFRSLSAPSTCSALAMRAMRRSTFLKSSMEMKPSEIRCRNRRACRSRGLFLSCHFPIPIRPSKQRIELLLLDSLHEVLVSVDLVVEQQRVRVVPLQRRDGQKLLNGTRHFRHHRLQIQREQPKHVQAHRTHFSQLRVVSAIFRELPRRVLRDVAVGFVRQRHHFAQGTTRARAARSTSRCRQPLPARA